MIKFFKKPLGIFILITIAVVFVIVIFSRDKKPSYEFVLALKKDITQEVNVTGRVKAADNIKLSFNVSGKVAEVLVKVGDEVNQGQVLAKLDTREINLDLQKEKIRFENLIIERPKDILSAENNLKNSNEALEQDYDNAYTNMTNVYAEMENSLNDIRDLYNGDGYLYSQNYALSTIGKKYRTDAENSYWTARHSLKDSVIEYRTISRTSPNDKIEFILSNSLNTAKNVAQSIKDALTAIEYIRKYDETPDNISEANEAWTLVNKLSVTINSGFANLLNSQQDISSGKRAVELDLIKLNDIVSDTRQFDIQLAEISIRQKEKTLDDHYIRSPISGIVTEQNLKIGEIISASNPLISVISISNFEIEANVPEADISKVNLGNISEVTLDAYGRDVIFITKVVSIDPAETVIEGVATYKITLQFDEEDERVKSGMTANIDILSENKSGVIAIPGRAIIRKDGSNFVKILEGEIIIEKEVKLGLRGSEGNVEILSGINEEDKVVISE